MFGLQNNQQGQLAPIPSIIYVCQTPDRSHQTNQTGTGGGVDESNGTQIDTREPADRQLINFENFKASVNNRLMGPV